MEFRPAIPTAPPHLAAFQARREGFVRKLATCITVLTAALAVLFVAAAAVVITIT
jgi:hypothetical protein